MTVTANAGGASAQTKIDVITQPDSISVKQNGKTVSAITVSAGETATLTASAMYRHLPVLGRQQGLYLDRAGQCRHDRKRRVHGVRQHRQRQRDGEPRPHFRDGPCDGDGARLRTLDGFETSFATVTGTRAMLSYNSEMTRVHNGYASARLDYATSSEGNATSASTMPFLQITTSSTSGSTATIAERSSRW